jgi:hypothetical protein
MRLRFPGISLILASALCVGCGPKHVSAPAPVDQGSFLVHLVSKQGETVRSISKWYTGSEKSAKEIAQLSNVRESTPLKVGQRVLIPTKYAKKTTPPPKPKSRPKSQQVVKKDEVAEKGILSGNESSPEPESITPEPDPLDPGAWTAPTEQNDSDTIQDGKTGDVTSEKPDPSAVVAAEPDAAASKPVESFEELLLKEQLEVERLRREMQAAPSAGAAGE